MESGGDGDSPLSVRVGCWLESGRSDPFGAPGSPSDGLQAAMAPSIASSKSERFMASPSIGLASTVDPRMPTQEDGSGLERCGGVAGLMGLGRSQD